MEYINSKEYNGICWMCNKNIANSKEHKYKNSDLKFLKKKIVDSIIAKVGSYKYINGIDSNLLKYDYVLCVECNNKNSKKIDNDYDVFSEKYIKHFNLEIESIFFKNEKLNFYRFLVKNFCCRLASNKIKISSDLIDFVNSKKLIPYRLVIQIYSNKDKIEKMSKFIGSNYADFGQGKLIYFGKTKQKIELYYSTLISNNLIFEFIYFNIDLELQNIYDLNHFKILQYNYEDDLLTKINSIVKCFDLKTIINNSTVRAEI